VVSRQASKQASKHASNDAPSKHTGKQASKQAAGKQASKQQQQEMFESTCSCVARACCMQQMDVDSKPNWAFFLYMLPYILKTTIGAS